MNTHNFLFNNLPAHQLLPHLITLTTDTLSQSENRLPWQVCWLNNDAQQVIGILPKMAWTVYPDPESHLSTLGFQPTSPKKDTDSALSFAVVTSQRQDTESTDIVNHQAHGAETETDIDINSLAKNISLQQSCDSLTYQEWVDELVAYSQAQPNITVPTSNNNNGSDSNTSNSDSGSDSDTSNSDNSHKHSDPIHSHSVYYNGLMGFIGYDIGAKALSPDSNIELANQPCAFLGHYDMYLTYNTQSGWQLHIHPTTAPAAQAVVIEVLQQLERLLQCHQPNSNASNLPSLPLTATWTPQQYQSAFAKTQQYLHQGDSYQINLTQQWQGQLAKQRLVNYLPNLHQNTQAPFAGYLAVNTPYTEKTCLTLKNNGVDFELLSCSPELFVMFDKTVNNEQRILTKPIKGTLPRGQTAEQDEQLKQQLANSEKDQAENVMIVDLLRNDLGKYAITGSVQVPKLFAIESFSNVHHMVSSITAIIRPDTHPLHVLFDSLPAGSITGTPKKRAVELINELEAAPRGAYCGTLGYLNFDGTGQWNVLIRSLQSNAQKEVALWAGGGITVGSQCDLEYQECLDKVGNLLAILDTDFKSNAS